MSRNVSHPILFYTVGRVVQKTVPGHTPYADRYNVWLRGMAKTAIAARQRKLEEGLDRLLKTATACPVTKALQVKLERAKHQMLTFCFFPGEDEATSNASERHLRPAIIARKVTNGYRAKRSADNEAAMRTTVDTARLKGATPYQTIRSTLG